MVNELDERMREENVIAVKWRLSKEEEEEERVNKHVLFSSCALSIPVSLLFYKG